MESTGFTLTRRALLKTALGIGAGVGFIGPWRWARAQARKPIVIGLTCDATGTFADSGQADRRGMILAIDEFNAKGGVLGRPIEHRWEDRDPGSDAHPKTFGITFAIEVGVLGLPAPRTLSLVAPRPRVNLPVITASSRLVHRVGV